jgi:RNA polymerase primary sigma factor
VTRTIAAAPSVIDIFLNEIGRYPLLNAEEETELAMQYEQGRAASGKLENEAFTDEQEHRQLEAAVTQGEQGRQRLIQCNLRLVVNVAKRYMNCGMPLGDLIQEGTIGLMEAIERYDYRRQIRFATYAVWWIRQTVQRSVVKQGRVIHLPVGMTGELYRMRKASEKLESSLGRPPTTTELADEMEMPPRKIRRLAKWNQETLSLEMPVGSNDDSNLGDMIQDRELPPMEDLVVHRQLRSCMEDAMTAHLEPRDREILCMRFGLDGHQRQTLEEVANAFGITRQRVCQLEERALRRLRHVRGLHELVRA